MNNLILFFSVFLFFGGWGVGEGRMMKLWIFMGGHRKKGQFLGVISKHSRAF